ncbi:MAG TPA: FAD-dependent monooxygenase [Polyangiaceae bacterium]
MTSTASTSITRPSSSRVLISGAGIAGPALAFWLARAGHACTVVERAPSLRLGGQAVDFRGPVHRAVLSRMSLWEAIHEHRTQPGDLVLLEADGSRAAVLPAVMTAGDVEILRGDLCALLHRCTRDLVEYRFGDSIAALSARDDGVDVTFASGKSDRFDIVVGADGLHSGVRALAFGDETAWVRHHGYRIATFAMPDLLGVRRGSLLYSLPGRAASVAATGRGDAARGSFVYRAGPMGEDRQDPAGHRRDVRERFADVGWEVPRILDAMDAATDLYVDAITTVHVDRYARKRVVLLGDAAYGGTLGGQGTSLALVGAYVLAGELARGDDFASAVARYEARMRPYATGCQKGAMRVGAFYAPRTAFGLRARNLGYRALTSRLLSGAFEWLVRKAASDFALPEYA